jgi:hypothetical protein
VRWLPILTAPGPIQCRRLRLGGSLVQPDRIVDRLTHASKGVAEHERLGALGIRRGEQHRDRAAVAVTKENVRVLPTAPMTVVMSSIQRSIVGIAPSGTGSEMPVPRLSKQITRPIVPSRSRKRDSAGFSHMISMLFG